MNRSCMVDEGVTIEASSKLAWIHPPSVPAPVGPTTSTSTQLAPPSALTSTSKMSAPGEAPAVLEYQRQ